MTKDECKKVVLAIIADIAPDEDISNVKPDLRLRDQLELDSMDFLDIVMELRKRHSIEVPEADYLQLAYSIELSNFTGQASNGLPPPSQKNAVDSSVTIPDGYTIVVGGLTTKSTSSSASTIPILGDIPFLRWLFGTHTANDNQSTLFVFIRPVILRDDKFEDLKYISGKSARSADLPGDFPLSHPVPMR